MPIMILKHRALYLPCGLWTKLELFLYYFSLSSLLHRDNQWAYTYAIGIWHSPPAYSRPSPLGPLHAQLPWASSANKVDK